MKFYDAAEIGRLLDVEAAIESQRKAFSALASGIARMPEKTVMPGDDGSLALNYTARVSPETGPVCKFVSFNPGNAERGLPSIHGMILALHAETGEPVAVLDGAAITTLRTAAASAVAADVLATPAAADLAVLGCGAQGVAHVRMLAAVRKPRRVRMFAPSADRLRSVTATLSDELGVEVEAARDAAEAVRDADLVALCTTSVEPVVRAEDISPGCTVISVGSFEPHRREAGRDVLGMARSVIVDDVRTAIGHAGPVLDGLAAGLFREQDLIELGDVLLGKATARIHSRDVLYYNSTGVGVQDAAAAWAVVDRDRGDQVQRG